ncbi:ASKHA domain-containing protein [Desulfosporosinus sp. OT]|uniref:ASKHA domain-containing protein n=1 Tax=Desulfosporosinus sp. OT TaxID=913865 RepID=UPI000223B224|nr:ASKHA domain-containing protein [Desulfosporosinus sp. OT]EGW39495.1 2Fe-2S iron-sulfur cluster binding domain protein [Desulfosporosinus sp. OT]
MVKVHFTQEDHAIEDLTIEVTEGERLTECIRAAGLVLETPCNGLGLCGKCRIKAWGDLYPPEDLESGFINAPNIRLACLARAKGEVWIELPPKGNQLKTINQGLAIEVVIDSFVKQVLLPPLERTAQPYLESLPYNFGSVDIYQKAGGLEQGGANANPVYGVLVDNDLVDLGFGPDEILGVAIDIGTTGISAYLLDLTSGGILQKQSCLNPQTEFGGDVLSRISYCLDNPHGPAQLREIILGKLNELVINLTGSIARTERVYQVVIAGNTTMLHFVLGIYPGSIARAPYRPVFLEQVDMKAREAGILICPEGRVTLLPSASGYVGADILAGVVATAFDKKDYPAVFLDIGTNGEIVANLGGRLIATSTAAGPALEGMNISCGCRAEEGAIDTFSIDNSFNLHFTTIGAAQPKGICGSGLIDITAAMVKRKLVLASGRFNPSPDPRIKDRVRDKKFYLTEEIYISQTDIRQIQLAKGAISAGVTLLLEEAGIPLETIEEAVIAGAFGYHINPDSIREIGLLPKGFKGKINFVGNSSAEGARLALINKGVMFQIQELKNRIEVLELSTNPRFQDYFVKALGF